MPNWCQNQITVRGGQQSEIQRLADAFSNGGLCQAVVPCPAELLDTTSGHQQAALEAKTAANLEKYGYSNWYDFNVSEWGTKWDVTCDSVEIDSDGLGFNGTFDSAWSPPIAVCEALIEQGFEVTLYYYEPGMAYVGKWEDGCDDLYEYGGEKADTVRAAIGDELDDMFDISGSMAEYEEVYEEEELTEWIKDGAAANEND